MEQAPRNAIGWTKSAWWADYGPTLEQTLADAGIVSTLIEEPYIVGLGGNAWLTCYTSPLTEMPVTVLCLPVRYEIDGFSERYYYFEGLTESAARATDWATIYGLIKDIEREHR